jgi:hypothetical protein
MKSFIACVPGDHPKIAIAMTLEHHIGFRATQALETLPGSGA